MSSYKVVLLTSIKFCTTPLLSASARMLWHCFVTENKHVKVFVASRCTTQPCFESSEIAQVPLVSGYTTGTKTKVLSQTRIWVNTTYPQIMHLLEIYRRISEPMWWVYSLRESSSPVNKYVHNKWKVEAYSCLDGSPCSTLFLFVDHI